MENGTLQRRFHIFLYFSKYFGDKYGVRGSIFGHIVGRSKNVPKSIAIEQESYMFIVILRFPMVSVGFMKDLLHCKSLYFHCSLKVSNNFRKGLRRKIDNRFLPLVSNLSQNDYRRQVLYGCPGLCF